MAPESNKSPEKFCGVGCYTEWLFSGNEKEVICTENSTTVTN